MASPTVTLAPAAPKPGDLITATITRDVPKSQPAAFTVALTGTTPGGSATGSLVVTPDPIIEALTLADASTTPHTWTKVDDNGTVAHYTTTA